MNEKYCVKSYKCEVISIEDCKTLKCFEPLKAVSEKAGMYCHDCKSDMPVRIYNGSCSPVIYMCSECGQFIASQDAVRKKVNPVMYSINQEKYDHALNLLSRSFRPIIEFTEDMDAMRKEAKEISEKSVNEAYELFSDLIS